MYGAQSRLILILRRAYTTGKIEQKQRGWYARKAYWETFLSLPVSQNAGFIKLYMGREGMLGRSVIIHHGVASYLLTL